MKKFIVHLMVIAAAISCVKEPLVEENPDLGINELPKMIIKATTEDDESKTALGADNGFLWNAGDRVAVYYGSSDAKSEFVAQFGNASTTNLEGPNIIVGSIEGAETSTLFEALVGVYPYDLPQGIEHKGGKMFEIDAILPTIQSYAADSFGQDAFPMVAITPSRQDKQFAFKNLCGIIQLQVLGDNIPVRSISISGNNNEKICGAAVISMKHGGLPSISFKETAQTEVILDCGNDVSLSESTPTSFYIVLPPVAFTKGISIKFETDNGIVLKKTAVNFSISRSKILPIKAFRIEDVVPGHYVDEYGIDHGQGVSYNGVIWAPVNCGYRAATAEDRGYPYGKMYQWGRKYGSGYKDSQYEDATFAQTIWQTFQGEEDKDVPDKYYSRVNYADPYHRYNLGTETEPVKSDYDPCPKGWRVPTDADFHTLPDGEWTIRNNEFTWVNTPHIKFYVAGSVDNYRGVLGYYASSKYNYYEGVDEDGDTYVEKGPSICEFGDDDYQYTTGCGRPETHTHYDGFASSVRCVLEKNNPAFKTRIQYVAISKVEPNGMTSYLPSESTFKNGRGEIVLSGLVSTIPQNAFANKDNLIRIDIPSDIAIIEAYAFEGCDRLVCVNMVEGINTLKDNCFANCSLLESLVFPSSLTYIGKLGCGLKVAEFTSTKVPSHDNRTFNDVTVFAPVGIANNKQSSFRNNFNSSSNCEVIFQTATAKVRELSYTIQTSTEPNAYSNSAWTAIVASHEYGKIQFVTPPTSIPMDLFRNNKDLISVSLPLSINIINSDAFNDCSNLREVKNIDRVKDIRDNAFDGCTALNLSTLNAEKLGYAAFQNCTAITTMNLPNIKTMNGQVFAGCTAMTSITFGESLSRMGTYELSNTAVKTITALGVTAATVNSSTFSGMQSGGHLLHPNAPDANYATWIQYLGGNGWTHSDHDYVDLGLPSGTLWATEDASGYCTYSAAASEIWNSAWELPTSTQWQELYNNCTPSGYYTLISKSNGKSITISNENWGYYDYNGYKLNCFYWSSDGQYNKYAYWHAMHEDDSDRDALSLSIGGYGTGINRARVRLVRKK